MAWIEPKFSGTRRTKAGVALAREVETDEDLEVINNWRSSHSQPLQTIKMMLKGRAKRVDEHALIAQRLKRLSSIRSKLKRETMRLQQMQDLGGCRAVVKDMTALRALKKNFDASLKKAPKRADLRRHQLVSSDDYIASPKEDGYRSIHYVFAYRTNTPHLKAFDGHLIEVQIRTRLQHAWATAVEIVDTFTGQSLKSALRTNVGDTNWRRFFSLMGTALAVREKTTTVPGTPDKPTALQRELRSLARKIDVERILSGLGEAVKMIGNAPTRDAAAYVLELNAKEQNITVTSFSSAAEAAVAAFEAEVRTMDDPTIQVVQVAVEKVDALRAAYPNYYLDTSVFVRAFKQAVS